MRRALVPLLALAGCGFHPVYGTAGAGGGTSSAELAAINVERIPERAGQLLRGDLQTRFESSGTIVPKRYDLTVAFTFTQEGIAINPDNTASRIRYTAVAAYVLRRQDADRSLVTSGTVRAFDNANVINNQYFAADLETDTVLRRLANQVADGLTQQLAVHFREQPGTPAKP